MGWLVMVGFALGYLLLSNPDPRLSEPWIILVRLGYLVVSLLVAFFHRQLAQPIGDYLVERSADDGGLIDWYRQFVGGLMLGKGLGILGLMICTQTAATTEVGLAVGVAVVFFWLYRPNRTVQILQGRQSS